MATLLSDLPPTPTSLTMIRPGIPISASSDELDTRHEAIDPIAVNPELEDHDFQRFMVLRHYARGGQGNVLIARDLQLSREVALKELKQKNADRPASRVRFLREAEITGSLEHPGVAPVYTLGRHPDGRPYYTMRLIEGRTLHQAIAEFHRPTTALTPAERNLRFRQLLQRFVSVCQTVAFAHSRGIIHRDIKPANVLIGAYGEAIVLDWGLARRYDLDTGCTTESDADPGIYTPDDSTPPDNSTRMGTALGTPAFMSPEQADGAWAKVGPPADVYSLGATLYVLVSGRLPLSDLQWPEMAERIRNGDIPPPMQVNPTVPRPLDAVCRKAMSVNPADRYSTALALAEDIEHWLADEPVSAEPEPVLEQARRWVRRHRTFVAAVAGLWTSLCVALSIGLVMVNNERQQKEVARLEAVTAKEYAELARQEAVTAKDNTELARQEAVTAKDNAELARQEAVAAKDNTEIARKQARSAFDNLSSRVVNDWLKKQYLSPTQKQILSDALRDYEEFANQSPSDSEARFGVARASVRAAEICIALGEFKDAEAALLRANAAMDALRSEMSNSRDYRLELANLRTVSGKLRRKNRDASAAELDFAAARAAYQLLYDESISDKKALYGLATSISNHATAQSDLKQAAEATASLERALQLFKVNADLNDHLPDAEREVASAHTSLATRLIKSEKYTDAERHLLAAVAICETKPSGVDGIEVLARAQQQLGVVYHHLKMPDASLDRQDKAIAEYELLAKISPSIPDYLCEAATLRYNLANRALMAKNHDSALVQFDAIIRSIEQSLLLTPATPRLLDARREARLGRIRTFLDLRRYTSAMKVWDEIIQAEPGKIPLWLSIRAVDKLKAHHPYDALKDVQRVVEDSKANGECYYNLACYWAQARKLETERSIEHSRDATAPLHWSAVIHSDCAIEYSSNAVAMLDRAKELKYFDNNAKAVRDLRERDRDLDPIRQRKEFIEFCNKLNQPNAK